MLSAYTLAAYAIWACMFFVWALGRRGNKKTRKKGHGSWKYALLYLSYILLFLPPLWFPPALTYGGWEFSGVLLCFAGAAFASWARFILGRNWSAAAVEKEEHELVERGPYNLVRHPIYLGLALAMLGFAATLGTPLALFAVMLGWTSLLMRIGVEEKMMREIFPRYEEYAGRVKKVIPFVW